MNYFKMDKNNYLVHYKLFGLYNNIFAFTTTKSSISSNNPRFTGDTKQIYVDNRRELASILDVKPSRLIFPRQTHTNCVVDITAMPEYEISETDALVTNLPGMCLCVQTADCVPILLFDPNNKVISAIHAGWRGTVDKIVEIALQKMVSNYCCSPANIIAAIGPSISHAVYEVGNEVIKAAKNTIPGYTKTILRNNSGKFHFDLWEANRQILLKSGVRSENIEILGECSFINDDKFYSARRDGVETGRMVSGIMILY